jgi:hypothetical protein
MVQRLEIGPLPKPLEEANRDDVVVKEQGNPQLVTWLEGVEIVDPLQFVLFLTLPRQHAPPVLVAAAV